MAVSGSSGSECQLTANARRGSAGFQFRLDRMGKRKRKELQTVEFSFQLLV